MAPKPKKMRRGRVAVAKAMTRRNHGGMKNSPEPARFASVCKPKPNRLAKTRYSRDSGPHIQVANMPKARKGPNGSMVVFEIFSPRMAMTSTASRPVRAL